MLRIGETKVLFEKVAEYLKCLELFEGIVPGFAVMQQNLKQHLVKSREVGGRSCKLVIDDPGALLNVC